jgi:hypothetical protein
VEIRSPSLAGVARGPSPLQKSQRCCVHNEEQVNYFPCTDEPATAPRNVQSASAIGLRGLIGALIGFGLITCFAASLRKQ